ncbi:MAG: hypothetical protein V9H26_22385 [Verrucomicrobiota bacterium]
MAKSLLAASRFGSKLTNSLCVILRGLCFLAAASEITRGETPGAQAATALPTVSLAVSPLVPRGTGGGSNGLLVVLDSAGLTNVTLRLASPAWQDPVTKTLASIAPGKQTVDLEVPLLTAATPVTVRIATSAAQWNFGPFTLQPPRKWTVYLTQHTHTDIGYTRPQTEILPEHLRYIDYALDYCDLTDSYPDDARFRWTCETSWAVREYPQGAAGQTDRAPQATRRGRAH